MAPSIKHGLEIKFGTVYGPEEERAVLETLRLGAPTSGEACVRFEREFAAYCGTTRARAVSNGTAALFLSMIGIGVGPGDLVLTTPLTWIATAAAPATLGAEVDFVDVDPDTYNMDPVKLRAKLEELRKAGRAVKAVLPVHLYGQCCDMDAIGALAKEFNFSLVEDACHAIGAEWRGKKAGSFGVTGCFSFHEQKNMSTLGEGGMIVTSDDAVYERIALYRSHCTRVYGASTKYCSIDESKQPMGKRFWWQDFDDCGYNFRLTDIQAAVGLEQIRKLDVLNGKRAEWAARITAGLDGIAGLQLPVVRPEARHAWHLYPLKLDPARVGISKEDFVYRMLNEKGIKVGTHYLPLNWSQAFQKRGFRRGQFPVAEAFPDRLVTLPVSPVLSAEAIDYLVTSIRDLLAEAGQK